MSSRRFYTLDEVNAFVPELTRVFTRILGIRAQLKTIHRRLEGTRFAPIGDDFEPVVPGAPPEVVRDRTAFKGLIEAMREGLEVISAMGCQIKDLEIGLVDWFGKSGKRDVLLCWRLGEKEVAFFHDLDAGYAGRRPVSELEPPEELPARTVH